MKKPDLIKQLANRINQPHVIESWITKIEKAAYNKGYKDGKVEQCDIPVVVGQSEQLKASFQVGEKVLLDDHTIVEVLVSEPKLYIRQNEFDSEMWVNTYRLKKKSQE